MAEYDLPQPCPDCANPAPRLLTAAAIGGGAREAAAAPAMSHGGGCACCRPSRLSADAV
jgi:hypothetical protein